MDHVTMAGWGEADITPAADVVVLLAGQYYPRLARGLHSRLKTVALAFSHGSTCAVFVSLDVVGFSEAFTVRLQKAVSRAVPEIPEDALIVNAIHTHNAPGLKPTRPLHVPPPGALTPEAYQDVVEAKVVDAVKAAWEARRPCGTASVLESARLGHCRRALYADGSAEMYGRTDRPDFVGMEGGEDSGVDLLFVLDEGRIPTGVVVNVACPSQVLEAGYEISSDFMGALRERLKDMFGPAFHTLCQVGASGCQSPRDLSRNYRGEPDFWHTDGVAVLADRLCEAVRRGAARLDGRYDPAPVLARSFQLLPLPRRRVSYAEYRIARGALDALRAVDSVETAFDDFCAEVLRNETVTGRPGPYDDKLHRFSLMRNHEAVLRRYEEQDSEPSCSVQLHAVRVGRTALVTNPFELFLAYGQQIKARSPADSTFVIQLANGACGYLPTAEAEAHGGYGGLVINGQVGSDGGSLLADRTVEAVEALWV